jgi:hypothetical protein
MANTTTNKDTVSIPRTEYARLKKLDSRFREFFAYIEHLSEIRGARAEVKSRKFASQEAVFKNLGI